MILAITKKLHSLNFKAELIYALSLFILLLTTFSLIVSRLGHNVLSFTNIIVYLIYLISIVSLTRLVKIILTMISPRVSGVYEIVIHACVFILSFASIFLIIFFNTMFDYGVMQLINGTNNHECLEFLSTYVLTGSSLFILFLLALFLTGEKFISRWLKTRSNTKNVRYFLLFAFLSIPIVFYSKAFIGNAKQNFDFLNRTSARLLMYDPIFAIQNTYLQFNAMNDVSQIVANKQQNLTATCKNQEPTNIILVIGESFNKYHSSLYGYGNQTSPLLTQLQKDSSLYVFTDAVSTYNRTATSIQNIMSTAAYTDSTEWYNEPLFPAVFRQAGYNVNFISNAFALSGLTTFYRSEAFYLCDGVVSKQLFNYQNSQTTVYDYELIDNYRKIQTEVETQSNLIIFQLNGQHVDPSQRYPQEYNTFSASNIKRPKLDETKRQYIANYDNATLYNDKVISDIIDMYKETNSAVVYLADHGDEVYDIRDKAGRSYNVSAEEKDIIHCQIDIPLMIYVSPTFKERNAELVEKIKAAVNKKFVADDLPHVLFDLANITTPHYVEERDILSEKYAKNRRVLDGIDYDKVIADEKFSITYGL